MTSNPPTTIATSPTLSPYAHGCIVPVAPGGGDKTAYDIVIGDNILTEAGSLLKDRLGQCRCLIVTDKNVAPLYQARLEARLEAAGHRLLPPVVVEAGEGSKTFAALQATIEAMLASGLDRKSIVVALGGGVVGDLAGCAAGLALRGVGFVQVPTTLLAQVDSSVGGKTGVNSAAGKNTVGMFHQPRLVIADVALLDSLPVRELRAGYAEVVKYGLIGDSEFFAWCQTNGSQLLAGNRTAQIKAIETCCRHKAQIVAADEREAGERALLNFGHTFGHALEAITGFGSILLHGEAVAIGMTMAFRLSARLGLCPHQEAYDVEDHLAGMGLPVKPPPFAYDIDRLMALMAKDKKAVDGKLTLILACGIGRAFISADVDAGEVRALWEEYLKVG